MDFKTFIKDYNFKVISAIIALSFVLLMIFNLSPFTVSGQAIILFNLLIAGFIFGGILYKEKLGKDTFYLAVFVTFILTSIIIFRSPLFFANEYAHLIKIKNTKISDFIVDNPSQIRSVTRKMALVKANKILGIKVNGVEVSTQFQLDEGNVIKYKNNEYWLFSLEPSSFFSWLSNKKIPGYVLVSATDPNAKALFVQKSYTIGKSYLWNNIDRIGYFETFFAPTFIHFEIDENGNPYWIVVKEHYKFYGVLLYPESVRVVNAITGKTEYNGELKDAPKWIDKLFPEDITKDIIEYYGKYQKGFWNAITVMKNVMVPTNYHNKELWLIENKTNNHLMWFTGLTSPNKKDNSLINSIAVDTRNCVGYKINDMLGITDEEGAIEAIDSKLGANSIKWAAVLPMPVFMNNDFYWVASIVNKKSSIYQKEGLVKGNDITQVKFADSLQDAINNNSTIKSVSKKINKKVIFKKIDKIEHELQDLKKLVNKIN